MVSVLGFRVLVLVLKRLSRDLGRGFQSGLWLESVGYWFQGLDLGCDLETSKSWS